MSSYNDQHQGDEEHHEEEDLDFNGGFFVGFDDDYFDDEEHGVNHNDVNDEREQHEGRFRDFDEYFGYDYDEEEPHDVEGVSEVHKRRPRALLHLCSIILGFMLFTGPLLHSMTLDYERKEKEKEKEKDDFRCEFDESRLSFKFTVLWPKGYCKARSSGCTITDPQRLEELPANFTIHGLWSVYRGGCRDSLEIFDERLIPEYVRVSLLDSWPNLKKFGNPGSYAKMWEYEWINHGKKCNLFTVIDYLSRNLELLKDIREDVFNLEEFAQWPTNVAGVRAKLGNKPNLKCRVGDGGYFLTEIEFCLDVHHDFVDCKDKSVASDCQEGREFSY